MAMAVVLPMVMSHFTRSGQQAPPQTGFGGVVVWLTKPQQICREHEGLGRIGASLEGVDTFSAGRLNATLESWRGRVYHSPSPQRTGLNVVMRSCL
jgi:hypothetical protein